MIRNAYCEMMVIIVKSNIILNVTKFGIKCKPKNNDSISSKFKLTANVLTTVLTDPIVTTEEAVSVIAIFELANPCI